MNRYNKLEDIIGLVFEDVRDKHYEVSPNEKDPTRIKLTQVKGGTYSTNWDLESVLENINSGRWKVITSPEPNYEIY